MDRIPGHLKTLGEVMRWARERHNISLSRLAESVGVTTGFLSDVENGHRCTTKIALIAAVLHLDPRELALFDGRMSTELRLWLQSDPRLLVLLGQLRRTGVTTEQVRAALEPLRDHSPDA